jgi:hypothetical protein
LKRKEVLRQFRDEPFGLEALPLLRKLIEDDDVQIVICAAECVARLGPEALTCPAGQENMPAGTGGDRVDLGWQLQLAGSKFWGYSLYANCYSACLDALVKLQLDEDVLLEYIHLHIGLSDDDFLDSLKALKTIGTPEARDLARRAVAFWRPELDKTHTKQLEKILGTSK